MVILSIGLGRLLLAFSLALSQAPWKVQDRDDLEPKFLKPGSQTYRTHMANKFQKQGYMPMVLPTWERLAFSHFGFAQW